MRRCQESMKEYGRKERIFEWCSIYQICVLKYIGLHANGGAQLGYINVQFHSRQTFACVTRAGWKRYGEGCIVVLVHASKLHYTSESFLGQFLSSADGRVQNGVL